MYVGSSHLRVVVWVWAAFESAVLSAYGECRWPSTSGYLVLAGEEVQIRTCFEYGMCNMLLPYCI